jgi:uncharacterized membrane protein YgcG
MKAFKLFLAAAVALALVAVPASALAKRGDRNHDRIPDKWERKHHLSTRVNVARKDPDRDGLSNLSEFRHGTDPRDADTDDDGINDKQEIEDNNNPNDDDTDDDGIKDEDENSGTIKSFDGTTLVIQLAAQGAGEVSGMVTDQTEIECENEDDDAPTATKADDGGSSGSGSDGSGHSGSGSSGSDDGGHSGPGSGTTTTTTTTSGSDDNSGPGNNHDEDEDEDEQEGNCTKADLTPGTPVHEAELVITPTGLVFEEIELVK